MRQQTNDSQTYNLEDETDLIEFYFDQGVTDGIFFEKAGIPTAVFAKTEFSTAPRAQAIALGFPDFEVILVEHPIQPLTSDEVHNRADAVFEQLLTKLTQGAKR